ncbi:protein downstream neighbor of Son isoform X1 [Punica granatum]|nr:protein downstream neighbor of Son isoform X1 [Punica granatum]
MATVAGPGALPPESLRPGGGGGGSLKVGTRVRRKTPSELRGEQLKQANVAELVDESPAPLLGSINSMDSLKKPGALKPPRYIDMRVDEVYPAKKSRFKMISAKENAKENHSVEHNNTLRNISTLSSFAAQRKHQLPGQETSTVPPDISDNMGTQTHQRIEACSLSKFRNVAEISSRSEKLSSLAAIDMDKALKGLAAQERSSSGLAIDSAETSKGPSAVGNMCAQGTTISKQVPIDLTLKTAVRVVSSSPLNRIYRSIMQDGYGSTLTSCFEAQKISSSSGIASTSSDIDTKGLHSWIYPQSTLPSSLISVLISSATEKVEMDFLKKRELGWEESFRSLYYMLRKRACHIFYVCTSQFVVMFTGNNEFERTKQACNAYVSRSTRGLRSLLREHDVSFSMPLCLSKVEQVTTEDLVELSEIEKNNLGQARKPSSLTNIDNSPQSLLALCGNENVQCLYDVLLNYRSSLPVLAGEDVPLLFSPVPFRNAALSMPEVRCIEMKQADRGPTNQVAESTLSNSLEIKDSYLPPWIVCNLCQLVGSLGSFEASFMTEGISIGLNAALEAIRAEPNSEDPKDSPAFGISEATVSPFLLSGSLKSLRFCDGSYTASISPA